jgi:signal transduction histidine kinase
MKRRWWGIALLPVLAGLVLATLVMALSALPDSIIYFRANLDVLVFLAGLLLSVLIAIGLALWIGAERRRKKCVTGLRAKATKERRRFVQRLDHELKNPLTAIRAGPANVVNDSMGADVRRLSLVLPQVAWPVPNVSGDWDLFFLAVYNLLDNALKFTRPGDTVEVRAFEDGSAVVIEVADTGPGIPQEEVPCVWEELYRGQSAQGVPGSGLGLALVRAIVERHGGRTTLRSRIGQGTVVAMRLPVR